IFGLDHRAHRDFQHQVLAPGSVTLLALAGRTVLGLVDAPATEVGQRCQALVRLDDHVTTPTAIASVRPTHGHELLPAIAHGTITTRSANNVNFSKIAHLISIIGSHPSSSWW